MKILHIGDLHLGKKIGGYSLLEDQKYFLDETISLMKEKGISHIIMAGDIYDISTPSGDAISLFASFLKNIKDNNFKAFIISGNHDSKARLSYLNELIQADGIFINTDIKNAVKPFIVDGINYYLIPYTTSSEINSVFDKDFKEYSEALDFVVKEMNIDETKINIAVSHQLVLRNNELPDFGHSEDPVIGTIQNIPSSIYSGFTYTALGHIHKPQKVADNIYYAGSPFPYHIDETKYNKNYQIIEIDGNNVNVSTEPIKLLHNTVIIEDTFDNIVNNYAGNKDDYVYAVITDSEHENAMAILKEHFPYIINLRYKQKDAKGVNLQEKIKDIEKISFEELFGKFYQDQLGKELTDFQKDLIKDLFSEEGDDNED